jgi:hypothetical protein
MMMQFAFTGRAGQRPIFAAGGGITPGRFVVFTVTIGHYRAACG